MKLAKKWRPVMRILVILTILVPYFSSLAVLLPQDAEAVTNEPQVIFNEENHGKVEASYAEKETTIEWTIDYQKYQDTSTNDDVQRLMKLRLEQVANGVGTVKNMNDSGLMEEDGWYVEKEFSAESKGTLIVEMPKDVLELTIEVQMDEQRTTIQEVETAVLAAETEEAAEEPEVQAEVQTEEISETAVLENVLPQQAAGPHQVAAEVAEEVVEEVVEDETVTNEEPVVAEEAAVEADIQTEAEGTTEEEPEETPSVLSGSLMPGRALSIGTFDVPVDPFVYYTGEEGTFPEHWTDKYLGTITSNPGTVKNYDYGSISTVEDEANTELSTPYINSEDELDFTNGYHKYEVALTKENTGSVFTKKTVSPTDDPYKFDIELDMIGDAIYPPPMIDVVLVLDKSGSMLNKDNGTTTRWQDLQGAVKAFADNILTPGRDIQVGLVGFGTKRGGTDPWAETALFPTTANASNGFTKNASEITGHHVYNSYTPKAESDSYTPTFLGVDAGLHLLTSRDYGARPEAYKVLITVTDGLPTIRPLEAYSNGNSLTTSLGRTASTTDTTNKTLTRTLTNSRYYSDRDAQWWESESGTIIERNQTVISNRFNETALASVLPYSVGVHLSTNATARSVLLTLAKGVATNRFYADKPGDLLSAFDLIVSNLISTVSRATLIDPMSEYVTLDPNSIVYEALQVGENEITVIPPSDEAYPAYAERLIPTSDTDSETGVTTIKLEDISLGGEFEIKDGKYQIVSRDGFRIRYTVRVTDPRYMNGTFYPANEMTYLQNSSGQNFHFAIPSVKVPPKTFDVEVAKIWEDFDNIWQMQEDIVLQLQQQVGTTWQDVEDKKLMIPADSRGDALTDIFKSIPIYNTEDGSLITYRVIEKVGDNLDAPPVLGYRAPTYSPISFKADEATNGKISVEVTNHLPTTKFSFTKVGYDGENPLVGAGFTLYRNGDKVSHIEEKFSTKENRGLIEFTRLPAGEYTIVETTVPKGHKPADPITFTVELIDEEAVVTESNLVDETVANVLYPFTIDLVKENENNTELKGAEFTLTGGNLPSTGVIATSDEDGKVHFDGLQPGEYTLTETQAPEGYKVSEEGPWTVNISVTGDVTITDKDNNTIRDITVNYGTKETPVNTISGLTIKNPLKDFRVSITKEDSLGKLLPGAEFTLTAEELDYKELATSDSDGLAEFGGLQPGTYILEETGVPENHVGLENSITINIDKDGNVTVDGDEYVVKYEEDDNVIELTITNTLKGMLPETGGPGRKASLILSLSLLIFAMGASLYYVYRNRKGAK